MANATTLGFDLSYDGAQPQATLAYKRAEVSFVPVITNYTPDTLMEFRFKTSIFTSAGGIYSRMATGPNATVAAPAALMMVVGWKLDTRLFTSPFLVMSSCV